MASTLVVGASGVVGRAVVEALLLQRPPSPPSTTPRSDTFSSIEPTTAAIHHRVFALARRPPADLTTAGAVPVATDLAASDAADVAAALAAAGLTAPPDLVVIAAWLRCASEAENVRVNARMVRNLLAAVRALSGDGSDSAPPTSSRPRHVALVTGLKHYLGPFEAYGKGSLPDTPFRESQGRLDGVENFYYAQEDELFAAAARDGFTWSVHRPHTIVGEAVGNAMNMGTTLAVYAILCKETGAPFRFPGSAVQWRSLTDMTDAAVLAKHVLWAAATPAAANQAFNIVNGDVFRWSWMWARIAGWFGVEPAPFDEDTAPVTLESQLGPDGPLADAANIWRGIAQRYSLAESDIHRLVSPWHTDADLGRPVEVVTDMSKSRRLGFVRYSPTDDSFFGLFERLRTHKIIP
ncbi:hypothetical protein HK405_013793 [Cladochytrium tenue]|nr:hypothetical protein HK405_013793 [Cladochytrium tenue]